MRKCVANAEGDSDGDDVEGDAEGDAEEDKDMHRAKTKAKAETKTATATETKTGRCSRHRSQFNPLVRPYCALIAVPSRKSAPCAGASQHRHP